MFNFSRQNNVIKAILLVTVAYLFLSLSSVFVKMTGGAIPSVNILFWQSFLCLLFVIPYSYKKGTLNFRSPYLHLHLLRDVFGALSYWTFFITLSLLDLVDATVLTYTAPFFIPFIARILIKEPVEKNIYWAIALGFIGMAFILRPNGHFASNFGFIIGIIAGIATATSIVSIRLLNTKNEPLSRTLFYFFLFSTIATFPFCLFPWHWPTLSQGLLLFLVGLTNFFGQILITYAYSFGTATFLSPLCYIIVIYNFLFGWMIFHDIPGWHTLAGAILVIIGGTLTIILKARPKNWRDIFFHSFTHHLPWWKRPFARFFRKKPPV